MNPTAEQLDQFLQQADPATAKLVEQIVNGLLALRSRNGFPFASGSGAGKNWTVSYRLPVRKLGARMGLDLTKLAHENENS